MLKIILSIFIITLLSSCAIPTPKGKTAAEVLFKEAKIYKKKKSYLLAVENLNSIKSQYPYSFYAKHAELMLADIQFEQEQFIESVAAYSLYRDFHPKSANLDYVIWRIAESYYFQRPDTVDRDLTPVHEAIRAYQDLVARFPNTKYKKESLAKIQDLIKMIELRENYIADFYFKTEKYNAAIFRYKNIILKFNKPYLTDHARLRITLAFSKLKDFKRCDDHGKLYGDTIQSKEIKTELESIKQECHNKL